jgi:tripartite-type tricarboxylate transporter receptor subunit TctC
MKGKENKSRGISLLTLLILALLAAPAAAQYPQRPVTLVVPFPAGGATDLIARLLTNELHEKLGQPFVVESRPGAGTTLAATAVARAAPDGATLLLATTSTLAIAPSVYKISATIRARISRRSSWSAPPTSFSSATPRSRLPTCPR